MTNNETAVTVIEPTAALQVNLDGYPESQYNRLIPVQTLGLGTDLIKPIVQAVQLRAAGPDGLSPDHYASPDIPQGRRALTKRALDALASVAGVDFTEERRLDDGLDLMVCGVQVRAEMLLPTGRRITTTGTKWVDMRRMAWKSGLEGAQAGKFKAMIYEHTASRARNRAIRSLLSLQQSYTVEELRKPFAVVSFIINMDHPEVRARVLDALAPTIAATFGPTSPQLSQGTIVEVPEAPEDDEPSEAPRALTAGRAPVTETDSATGDPSAPGTPEAGNADEGPDWMHSSTPPAGTAEPGLREIVAARLRDEGAPKGAASKPQLEMLTRIFADLGDERGRIVMRGLRALEMDPQALTAAQARAIGMTDDALGRKAFLDRWAELAG